MKNNGRSNSQLELLMVLTLLMLFGFTIFQLIITSSDTQKKIIQDKEDLINARVAASYVDVRLRQNDSGGDISLVYLEETGRNAIMMRVYDTDGFYFYRWIYYHDGFIKEQVTEEGDTLEADWGTEVIDVVDFDIQWNEERNGLITTIEYVYQNNIVSTESIYYLRANPLNSSL